MRRRIVLGIFVTATTISTVGFALWYSGVFDEGNCVKRGGTWVAVRKKCIVD